MFVSGLIGGLYAGDSGMAYNNAMEQRPTPQDKLEAFHQLVAEERYREARGILETEQDIDPEVAEKWQRWLADLHHEERLQAGVAPDLKKRNPDRALEDLGRMVGGTAAVVASAIPLWLLVVNVLTYETASYMKGGFFLLAALILGYVGWQRAARLISPEHHFLVGAALNFGLLIYLLTSGIPGWYYYDPVPFGYLAAAFALVFPACAYAVYWLGEHAGLGIVRLSRPAISSDKST